MQRTLVVVAGNAGHGKDSFANFMASFCEDVVRDSFANPLKRCVHLKTGIPMEVLNGPQEVKNSVEHGAYGQTPRKLMRDEGEEARQRIGKTVWMDRLADRFLADGASVWIVSDGRHPEEEMVALRARLADKARLVLILVERPSVPVDMTHISESAIAKADRTLFEMIVANTGTLDDLRQAAKNAAYVLGLGLRS